MYNYVELSSTGTSHPRSHHHPRDVLRPSSRPGRLTVFVHLLLLVRRQTFSQPVTLLLLLLFQSLCRQYSHGITARVCSREKLDVLGPVVHLEQRLPRVLLHPRRLDFALCNMRCKRGPGRCFYVGPVCLEGLPREDGVLLTLLLLPLFARRYTAVAGFLVAEHGQGVRCVDLADAHIDDGLLSALNHSRHAPEHPLLAELRTVEYTDGTVGGADDHLVDLRMPLQPNYASNLPRHGRLPYDSERAAVNKDDLACLPLVYARLERRARPRGDVLPIAAEDCTRLLRGIWQVIETHQGRIEPAQIPQHQGIAERSRDNVVAVGRKRNTGRGDTSAVCICHLIYHPRRERCWIVEPETPIVTARKNPPAISGVGNRGGAYSLAALVAHLHQLFMLVQGIGGGVPDSDGAVRRGRRKSSALPRLPPHGAEGRHVTFGVGHIREVHVTVRTHQELAAVAVKHPCCI
mmetsp:Transcript_7041/g.21460  ORF Transcript_7041/g.21460 Transcript_7041/m.21460 type:complete len:462 (-) Transcript_7041:1162-2547(-)